MTTLNRPDRIACDAFSDPNIKNLPNSGVYSRFTNALAQPLLNVKGIQLLRSNFVNPILQLNDACQLMFFYYRGENEMTTVNASNLRCVRLVPSNFLPAAYFVNYTRNKYFNTVAELVAALNTAASTNGDDVAYNPIWVADDIVFSYDATTRRISITGATVTNFYGPAAADDPNVLAYLATNAIKMNSYAGVITQPYTLKQSMNSRLGFAQSYYNKGTWWNADSIVGVASSTGVPYVNGSTIEADAFPILIGAQNLNVYCSILGASGQSSSGRKNLLACIPLETAALNVSSYTLTSVEGRELSVASEIYELSFDFTDDFGNPFYFQPNSNTQLEINVFY